MSQNLTTPTTPLPPDCSYRQLTTGKDVTGALPCIPGQGYTGTDLRCYPAKDQQVLEELWSSSLHRAMVYVTCVLCVYIVCLAIILLQETYQVTCNLCFMD